MSARKEIPAENKKKSTFLEKVDSKDKGVVLFYRVEFKRGCKSNIPRFATFGKPGLAISLFVTASGYVKPRKLLADSQYSAANLRETAMEHGTFPVIPYPRNQQVGVKGILRVDRKFRSHGPQKFKTAYKKRTAVERVFSRLKNLTSLTQHNLKGLAKVTFHSQLCILIMLLTV